MRRCTHVHRPGRASCLTDKACRPQLPLKVQPQVPIHIQRPPPRGLRAAAAPQVGPQRSGAALWHAGTQAALQGGSCRKSCAQPTTAWRDHLCPGNECYIHSTHPSDEYPPAHASCTAERAPGRWDAAACQPTPARVPQKRQPFFPQNEARPSHPWPRRAVPGPIPELCGWAPGTTACAPGWRAAGAARPGPGPPLPAVATQTPATALQTLQRHRAGRAAFLSMACSQRMEQVTTTEPSSLHITAPWLRHGPRQHRAVRCPCRPHPAAAHNTGWGGQARRQQVGWRDPRHWPAMHRWACGGRAAAAWRRWRAPSSPPGWCRP